jgi:large subunit ribosomal protein L10
MPKNKVQKRDILRKIEGNIGRAKSIIFAKFDALKVEENEDLRNELKAENNEYYVAKKTLLDMAFKSSKIDGLDIKGFDGKVAAVFGFDDEISPAKIVDKFRKGREEKLEFLGGILENKFISAKEISELAKLPSRTELYAKLVGTLNAPISGFVNALAGNLKNLVYVLKAIEEKK